MDKNTVWKEIPVNQLLHGAALVRRDPEALKHVSNSVAKSLLHQYEKLMVIGASEPLLSALAKRIFVDLSSLKLGVDITGYTEISYDDFKEEHSDSLQKLAASIPPKVALGKFLFRNSWTSLKVLFWHQSRCPNHG